MTALEALDLARLDELLHDCDPRAGLWFAVGWANAATWEAHGRGHPVQRALDVTYWETRTLEPGSCDSNEYLGALQQRLRGALAEFPDLHACVRGAIERALGFIERLV